VRQYTKFHFPSAHCFCIDAGVSDYQVTRNLIPTPQFAYARRGTMTSSQHVYEIRPRNDKRGVDLISDGLPFGLLWYGEPNAISNAIGYARFYSRSHHALIRVYDETGNVVEMHDEQARDFKDW
jgi:hypothetical protein